MLANQIDSARSESTMTWLAAISLFEEGNSFFFHSIHHLPKLDTTLLTTNFQYTHKENAVVFCFLCLLGQPLFASPLISLHSFCDVIFLEFWKCPCHGHAARVQH
eukprot:scpid65332/ scgid26318/ 